MATLEGLRREAAAKLALCIEKINTRSNPAIPLDDVLPTIDAIARLSVAEILRGLDPRILEEFLAEHPKDAQTPQSLLPHHH